MLSGTWTWLSMTIAILVVFASILGIFFPGTYTAEHPDWARQAVGQDIGNLIAFAVMMVSTPYLRRGYVAAFYVWVGVLLYFVYAYLLYAFFIQFNLLFFIYVAVLGLSVFSLLGAFVEQDYTQIARPASAGARKSASVFLIAIGVLFGLLWLSEIIPAMIDGTMPASAAEVGLRVNPVHVIDLALVLPGMIVTGILLRQNRQLGHILAAPWLVFVVLMGLSIIATLITELAMGSSDALPPLVMVGLVVVAGALVAVRYLRDVHAFHK